uniref:Uncharacterized protein n=1 Tax=Moniliophthora roreri TaxID=221103 RepID=A0A0W0FT27_MONRR
MNLEEEMSKSPRSPVLNAPCLGLET